MNTQVILAVVLRSLSAVLVGGVIGCERARHGRAAGMRTHILVCLGACMTSMTSMFVANVVGSNGDVFRISAQVVSGIGFLGAGMIILKNNNMITGLTTAAGVWTTGTIGVALGYGFYLGAFTVTALFLLTVILFARFERRRKTSEAIYLEVENPLLLNAVLKSLEQQISEPFSYQITAPKSGCNGHIGVNLLVEKSIAVEPLSLTQINGVVFAVQE